MDIMELIEAVRSGHSVKCPACKEGNFIAYGNPQTTPRFGCDKCDYRISLTVSIDTKR